VLVERDRELSAIEAALDEACLRRGGTLLVTGPAGIGKTALLQAAHERAAGRGMQVLAAAGGELEHELAFSVVQQMLDPALRSLPAAAHDDVLSGAAGLARPVFEAGSPGRVSGADPAAVGPVVHGLYWVCSNLADSGPLLLVVDDLHWVDEASLRFLSYLARRVSDLPILLMLAGRPVSPEHPVSRTADALRPQRLDLTPLSAQAVGILVRENLSGDPDDEFCRACATASGGNPFLLTEALHSLRADRIRPVAAEAGRVQRLRPDTIVRAVLSRVARAGPDAVRLARAAAVLGPAADLRRVAALAEVSTRAAAELLDRLATEAIIHRSRLIEFVHPLVRAAVYAETGEFIRAADHKRAARLLHDDGVPADELAPHLLAAEPESDPWTVQTLRAAATAAMARGAPEVAVPCLRRALAEPPATADRLPILLALGRSLGMANRPDEAAQAWRSAYELAEKDDVRAEIALELGALMIHTGRGAETRAAHELAQATIHDDDLERSARMTAVFATSLGSIEAPATWIARLDDIVRRRQASTDIHRVIAATLAYGAAATGDRPAAETARLAELAATGPIPTGHGWHLANFAGAALTVTDRLPEAIDLHDRAIAAARERGDAAEFCYLAALRSHVMLYAGRLLEAEADGRAAYRLRDDGDAQDTPLAAAVLANALVERGALTEAEQILADAGLIGDLPFSLMTAHFGLIARGRLRLRQGRVREALEDLRACGEGLTGAGYVNPGFALWRPEAALAHLRLGEADAAREVATENVALSRRFGAPLPTGLALHTAGLIEGGTTGLSLLEEAEEVLRKSTTDMWRGRVLVDYGAALRRAGHRNQAQEPLRTGLDIATRCGATALADRATDELVAAGGRPRRARQTGPESLTASELRVARLAADGATNREIAQALFVSLRTVEFHLTHAYRKLGIDSRQQLATALR
jgi:DNA-binding CsgD family transcriptional regulator